MKFPWSKQAPPLPETPARPAWVVINASLVDDQVWPEVIAAAAYIARNRRATVRELQTYLRLEAEPWTLESILAELLERGLIEVEPEQVE